MSAARIAGAALGLGFGLLFYFAYRTNYTLSNRCLDLLLGGHHAHLHDELRHWLPIPAALRGCLPSAIWCFVGASLCGGWRLQLPRARGLGLGWIFPAINASWEVVQWLHWTDGHADWRDVIAGAVGWWVAQVLFLRPGKTAEEISTPWDWRVGVLVGGLACMGVADVWR